MSERKVLQKYYPPDFDPAGFGKRKSGKKDDGPRVQTVRLMAPFSMRCLTCGEYIYKGRKFNSRKMTPQDEKYLSIQIHYFGIKCTRCSAEIVFRTDPKNNDYAMVKGAQRNIEPWHNRAAAEETDDQRLDRLEREEAEAAAEEDRNNNGGLGRDAMADLEAQDLHSRQEMAVADALDQRRQRNARIERAEKDGVSFVDSIVRAGDVEREEEERALDELAKREFAAKRAAMLSGIAEDDEEDEEQEKVVNKVGEVVNKVEGDMPPPPLPLPQKPKTTEVSSWGARRKPKRDRAALAGFKRL